MANFIAISGPSTTGKTSLVEALSTHRELNKVIFSPDIFDAVSSELISKGFFSEYSEIVTDIDYLCLFIIRLVDYYNDYIEAFKDTDMTIILDGCWIDLAVYTVLNMWYNRGTRSLQEEILEKVSKFDENISHIYLTKAEDAKYPVDKTRLRGKITTFRANRPLEIRYYETAKHFKNVTTLPSSDISANSLFIINDLKELGYL